MSVSVTVDDLSARLGGAEILKGVSFAVEAGEFVTLLGPSGSGKTTTLNVIAGFIPQSGGHVLLGGEPMDRVRPHSRNIGFVFQNYALFPHMVVRENVAFPLRTRGVAKAERDRRVADALELVGLGGMEKRRTSSLSGGQQQRVALARALVFEPRLLLLDEPLAALDKALRESMQHELKRIQREVGVTTIAVTHDQTEALTMSTRVAIMQAGKLEQIDRPEALYRRPATLYVARFLGEANLLAVDAQGVVAGFGLRVEGGPGTAVIRPEDLGVAECGATGVGELVARVEEVDYQGVRYRLACRAEHNGERVVVSVPPDPRGRPLDIAATVRIVVTRPAAVHVIAGAGEAENGAAEAAPVEA
jgi:putative spermidine/putrescine transport system ATP-binding protein